MKSKRWLIALLAAAMLAGCGNASAGAAVSADVPESTAEEFDFAEKNDPEEMQEGMEEQLPPVPDSPEDYSAWLALGWQPPAAKDLGDTSWNICNDDDWQGAALALGKNGYIRMNTWADESGGEGEGIYETDEGFWSLREENGETLLGFRLYLGEVSYSESGATREELKFEMPVLFLPGSGYAVLLDAGQDPDWFMGGYLAPDGPYILMRQELDEEYYPYGVVYAWDETGNISYLTIELEDHHDDSNGYTVDYQTFVLPDPVEYPGLYAELKTYNEQVTEAAKEAGTPSRRIEILRSDSQIFSFIETCMSEREDQIPHTCASGSGARMLMEMVVFDEDWMKESVITALNTREDAAMPDGWEEAFRAKEIGKIPFALDENGIWIFVSDDDAENPRWEQQAVWLAADPEHVNMNWFPNVEAVG